MIWVSFFLFSLRVLVCSIPLLYRLDAAFCIDGNLKTFTVYSGEYNNLK